jgi:hypothetical protein
LGSKEKYKAININEPYQIIDRINAGVFGILDFKN